jgi:hypothetical protein
MKTFHPFPIPTTLYLFHAPFEIEKHPHPISWSFAKTNKCGKKKVCKDMFQLQIE